MSLPRRPQILLSRFCLTPKRYASFLSMPTQVHVGGVQMLTVCLFFSFLLPNSNWWRVWRACWACRRWAGSSATPRARKGECFYNYKSNLIHLTTTFHLVSAQIPLLRRGGDVCGGAAAGGGQRHRGHSLRHDEAHHRRQGADHRRGVPGACLCNSASVSCIGACVSLRAAMLSCDFTVSTMIIPSFSVFVR